MANLIATWEDVYLQMRSSVIQAGFGELDERVHAAVLKDSETTVRRLRNYIKKLTSYLADRTSESVEELTRQVNETLEGDKISQFTVLLPEAGEPLGPRKVPLSALMFDSGKVAEVRIALAGIQLVVGLVEERDQGRGNGNSKSQDRDIS